MHKFKPSSRKQFREYIRKKGVFGRKKTEEDKKTGRDKSEEARHSLPYYVKRYLRELSDQKWRIVLLFGMGFLLIMLRAALPWTSKFMIDFVFPSGDAFLLVVTCGALGVIAVCQVLLSLLEDYTARAVTGNFTASIKRRVMKQLQQISLARIQELKVGGIITRLETDTSRMADMIFNGFLTPLRSLLMLAVGLGSLFFLTWKVTLICLAFCLVVVFISWTYFNVMRPFHRRLREDQAQIQGRATEVFGGVHVVRAFRRERHEANEYTGATHLLWRKNLYGGVLSMALHRSVMTLYLGLFITTWLAGGLYVMDGEISVGDLVAFTAFIEWLFQPIFMIMHSLAHLQRSIACTERTFDLLDEPAAATDKPDAIEVDTIREGFRFENVVFDYPDGTRALNNVNLEIPVGQVTALVGPSGAGKTTITNLVMRFYDVTDGRITLDGVDIRDIKLSSYRRLMSLVLQDVFLFDGTVRENIAYGDPDADMGRVVEAARVAHCHDFIENLDNGYDTIIGERGVKLSGGQKQRIALARAVLVRPQLLILDEATSFLDSESEALVQDALSNIFERCTSLAIAHRLSTVIDADKIVVMEGGEIVEQGRHEDLLERKGRYYRMYTKQMEKAERHKGILDWNAES